MAENAQPIRILLIEDNPGDARLLQEMLAEQKMIPFQLEWKDSLSGGLKRLAESNIDVVLLDLQLPDSPQRFNTLARTQSAAPELPIVILTGMDDETFAVNAMRKGVQDYLVKGRINGAALLRVIRYAIARKTGEEKYFTLSELKSFDGREGRPAYVVFQGRVYDVTASPLWKNGVHGTGHAAGNDLTEVMLGAPHGEEILAKSRIIGALARQESFLRKLVRFIERWHPHPVSTHFAIAYSIGAAFFTLLYLFTRVDAFEKTAWYLLILGFGFNLLSGLSGLFSWIVTYSGRLNRIFTLKIILTSLLVAVTTACFIWRLGSPDILTGHLPWSYFYDGLVMSLVPLSVLLGYYGGEIVYS